MRDMGDDQIAQIRGLVGEIRGEIKSEHRHTRDSIGELFERVRSNETRITQVESGKCARADDIEQKLINHTHDGQTVVRTKTSLTPKQIAGLVTATIALLSAAAAAIKVCTNG